MKPAETVSKHRSRLASNFGLAYRLPLDRHESSAIFPINTDLRRRQVGIKSHRSRSRNHSRLRRPGIDHHSNHGVGHISALERLQSVDAGVEAERAWISSVGCAN